MSNFSIPDYRVPEVQPQGRIPTVQPDAPPLAFGSGQGLLQLGQAMEGASDRLGNMFQREAQIANETRVAGDVNTFVAATNKALFTAPDAYLRTKGEQAIHGAQPTMDGLSALKDQLVAAAGNDFQRQRLTQVLNAHLQSAFDTVGRHVGQESQTWQLATAQARQGLNTQSASLYSNDIDKVHGIAKANYAIGVEEARIRFGVGPDSPIAQQLGNAAASSAYKGAIVDLIDKGQKRQALALYDQVKDNLGLKDDHSLHAAMQGVRTQVAGEGLANDALKRAGLPTIPGIEQGPGAVTPTTIHQAIVGQESAGRHVDASGKVLTSIDGAKGVGQIMPETFKQYALPGERIDNKDDNLAVSRRVIEDYYKKFGGDWQRIAVAYFSGEGNVAPAGSPTPWKVDAKDGNGKATSSYVADVGTRLGRGGGQAGAPPGAAPAQPPNPAPDELTQAGLARPPADTRFKGDLRAGFDAAKQIVMNGTGTPEEKRAALAILAKQGSEVTGYQTAAVKSLRDQVNATLASAYLQPDSLKPGTLSAFADRAAALGEQELATRYRALAEREGIIRNGLAMAPADQVRLLKELSEGLPKQILEARAGGNADKLAAANDSFAAFKKAFADGLEVEGLTKKVVDIAKAYEDAGHPEKAREVQEYLSDAVFARKVAQRKPIEQEQMRAELEQIVARGDGSTRDAQLYDLMNQAMTHQRAAFEHDALSAGSALYNLPLPEIDWSKPETVSVALAQRQAIASQIGEQRGGIQVLPFTAGEMDGLRHFLDGATPDQASAAFRSLSALPSEAYANVAAKLAGKNAGDTLSQGYAAALGLYRSGDPADRQAADNVLRGALIRKNMGEAGVKPAATGQPWQQELQTKLGNVFDVLGATAVPSTVSAAIELDYLYRMHRDGRQGDKIDTDVLDQSIKSVLGDLVDYRGQKIVPPSRGAGIYDIDNAMGRLTDAMLPDGLKTESGQAVTADMIRRSGKLYSYGDGTYVVKLPDRGDLKPIRDPRTGQAFVLGLSGLMDEPAKLRGAGSWLERTGTRMLGQGVIPLPSP